MAKTVQPIAIELGIKGGEKLGALNRSFRDLSKQVKLSDADITQAAKDIIIFAKKAGNSEATIRGQIKAFEGLQKQAEVGGKAFAQLGNGIDALKGVLHGASNATEAQRKALVNIGSSANATTTQIEDAITALTRLGSQVRPNSDAFDSLGESIERLTTRLGEVSRETEELASAQKMLNRSVSASAGGAQRQIQGIEAVTRSLRQQRDELGALGNDSELVQRRLREGLLSLIDRGVQPSGRRSFEDVYAESLLSSGEVPIKGMVPVKDLRLIEAEVKRVLEDLQNQIEASLTQGIKRSFQETARAGRESARAMAAAFADPEFLGILGRLDQRIGELPNTTAGFNQRLRELQQQLANTSRDSAGYVLVSLEIARVQREAAAATQGLGAALIKDLASGVAVRNQKNLREAIGQLQAEMSELNTETAEGSAKYAENARQVNNLQKELDDIANSYRTVADMARQATGAQAEYANTRVASNYLRRDIVRAQQAATADVANAVVQAAAQTPLLLPAAGGTTAPGTGAFMSGLAKPKIAPEARLGGGGEGIPVRPQPGDVQAISAKRYMGPQATDEQLDVARRQYISQTEAARQNAEAKKAAAQAEESYRAEIDKARKANDGSINSSNRLRSAIIRFRDTLPTTGKEFAELTKEINDLDRQSERVSRRMSRRRMSPMQMTQAAGAVLSGGIFGGPEGFVGGAIGALGGVGGAFAGAAIGAQVGGIRRTLGEYADYAAEIKRLEIALKGITKVQDDAVASQANYSRGVAAAADVTKDLNVPQEVAIRGITRLTAAVKGAGGGVADAELAFKNITSAITATGGGAEQVQGAVTALVQIFSKGKVSAEEINQIAERLPGTFNKIAEASGRTGPELTKALQKGEVGLNDLMKFLVQLGGEYGELAKKIAGSTEAAGQRLQVAYNNMRIEVGEALQPIGAEFQDVFTEFIEDITPALVAVLPKIGEFFLLLAQNIDTVVVAMTNALAVFAVGKIAAIVASIGGLSAAFFTLKVNAIVATKALVGLNGAALLNPYTALATGVAAFATNLFLAAKEQKRLNILVREGSIADVESEISTLRTEKAKLEPKVYLPKGGTTQLDLRYDANASRLKEIDDTLEKLEERRRIARIDATQGAGLSDLLLSGQLTQFEEPKPDGTGDGTGGKGPKSQLEGLKAQYGSMVRGEKGVLEIMSMRQEQAMLLARATADNNQKLITMTNLNNISLDFAEQQLQLENKLLDDLDKAAALEIKADRLQAEKNAQLEYEIKLSQLLEKSKGAIALEEQRAAIAAEQRQKALGDEIFDLRDQLGLVTDDERIDRYRAQLEQQYGADDPRAAEAADLFRQQVAPTFAEGLGQKIRELKDELKELVNPINQITFAANTIGTAFSQSFSEVITGSKSIKEALSDAFASIGKAFIDMATQIIAKQLVLITLGLIQQALGVGAAAASTTTPPTTIPGAATQTGSGLSIQGVGDVGISPGANLAAKGAYFDGQTARFAKGGIVSAPTPFKFSDGGTIKNGLMGEAGPEAIMPLKRAPDGRLGVSIADSRDKLEQQDAAMRDSATRDKLEQQDAAMRGNEATRQQLIKQQNTMTTNRIREVERTSQAMLASPSPIDVRYESSVINNVEYVTAEQHQAGMAQAAQRGRALTLAALQNSVKARRRVGL